MKFPQLSHKIKKIYLLNLGGLQVKKKQLQSEYQLYSQTHEKNSRRKYIKMVTIFFCVLNGNF